MPVGFPVAATIRRERLLPVRAVRLDLVPAEPHPHLAALVAIAAMEGADAVLESADHRRFEQALEVVGPVQAPLPLERVVQAQGHAAIATRPVGDELVHVADAAQHRTALLARLEVFPFLAPGQPLLQPHVAHPPAAVQEIEVVPAFRGQWVAGRRRIDKLVAAHQATSQAGNVGVEGARQQVLGARGQTPGAHAYFLLKMAGVHPDAGLLTTWCQQPSTCRKSRLARCPWRPPAAAGSMSACANA